MSKIIDITEKLNFTERPSVKIGDTIIEINNDAIAILKVTAILTEEESKVKDAYTLFTAIFDEKNQKKVEKLHLDMKSFETLVKMCADLVLDDGDEEDEGETQTPATT